MRRTAGASPGGVSVGLSISTMDNPFFVALRDGAEAEAKATGINLITVDAQNDAAKQIAGVEVKAGKLAATVQQKPDLIGKTGVDTAKLLIEGKAVDPNIPVPLALITQ